MLTKYFTFPVAAGLDDFTKISKLSILTKRIINQLPTDNLIDDLEAIRETGATIILLLFNNDTLLIETMRMAKCVSFLRSVMAIRACSDRAC